MIWLDWTVIAAYFGLLAWISWSVIRQNKDTADDYFLAGRHVVAMLGGGFSIRRPKRLAEFQIGREHDGLATILRPVRRRSHASSEPAVKRWVRVLIGARRDPHLLDVHLVGHALSV